MASPSGATARSPVPSATPMRNSAVVTVVERFGFVLAPIVARLHDLFPDLPALGDPLNESCAIDADGLGRALWTNARRWPSPRLATLRAPWGGPLGVA